MLRHEATRWHVAPTDTFVPRELVTRFRLRDGCLIEGMATSGSRPKLTEVTKVDGMPPEDANRSPHFKTLVTIDPDSHYCLGDATDSVSLRVIDLLCPIGRGQRALIVAPPRTGKTTLIKDFAKGIVKAYPESKLVVLLVDERPEEATDWSRTFPGCVFAATSDQHADVQCALAELVWNRCLRMVEMGQDVVLLLDSLTRLARTFNRNTETSGRTMSGGVDARALERPRQIFGAARNTENGGSLTIMATALIETGSRMDELIFQEFKGTGNSELVLSRRLADLRIFPAIDIAKSGTRKEEKLLPPEWLKRVHMLRRVVLRMKPEDAMEKLVEQLSRVKSTEAFLKSFDG